MPSSKSKLDQVTKVQKPFERLYSSASGVLGVGIGENRRRDGFALTVYIDSPEHASAIPKYFRGVEVICDIVGSFDAF